MLRQVISRVCTREDSAIAKNAVSITRIVAERKRERERERERARKGVVDLLVKEQVDRLNVVDATWPRHWWRLSRSKTRKSEIGWKAKAFLPPCLCSWQWDPRQKLHPSLKFQLNKLAPNVLNHTTDQHNFHPAFTRQFDRQLSLISRCCGFILVVIQRFHPEEDRTIYVLVSKEIWNNECCLRVWKIFRSESDKIDKMFPNII